MANVTTQKPNQFTAYERFTPHGPIAFLPVEGNRFVLIFTVDTHKASSYLSMSDNKYLEIIENEFGRRLGKIQEIGKRDTYPIFFIEAVNQFQENLILLGNAAHTIHPNAAQGFNLGLRDVAGLAECIYSAQEKKQPINDMDIFNKYIELRHSDQQRIIKLTNSIASSFYNTSLLSASLANTIMLLLDFIPEFRSLFLKRAMGLAGYQPRLVRGLQL